MGVQDCKSAVSESSVQSGQIKKISVLWVTLGRHTYFFTKMHKILFFLGFTSKFR